MTLTRTLNNDPAGSVRTYTRTVSSSTSSAAVIDGLGNTLNYSFLTTTNGPYETHRQAYNGPATGTPVLDRVTCYNGVSPTSCQTTVPSLPITQLDTYETADGLKQRGSTSTYDTYGDVLTESDYDYGTSSSRGSLLRTQTNTYLAIGPVASRSQIAIQDGSGNYVSIENLTYDGGIPTATSGLPQHVSVSAPRGNLTGDAYLINNSTSGMGHIPAFSNVGVTYYYDDAGQILSSYSSAGNTTTNTYDTAYDAYLTAQSMSTVGTATQSATYTPDFNTGLTLNQTINGHYSSFTYDSMLRQLSATAPDGGVTTYTYNPIGNPSTSSPATSSVSVLHAGTTYTTQTTNYDWYGRTLKTDLTDDVADDLTTYAYDANGNLASYTNPYKSGATPATNYATYDVLGRQLTLKEPDCSGSTCSTQTYAPLGNTTTITDEAGRQRELFLDGIGRTTEVLEPDPTTGTLSLETDYLYNQNPVTGTGTTPSTYQTIINQKGGSTSSTDWRTRTFTYDLVGRLLSQQTPEAGTTTYTYTQSNCGIATHPCTRTDARGVVTTYTYDILNRLTGISYSTTGTTAATTPSVSYYYDQTSFNGLTIANGLGQRTGMSDGSGSTAWSYDPMGRIATTQKTINGITLQADFTYNLDGTINTLQDFGGTTLTYGYTSAGRQSSVTDAAGNSYASAGIYNAAGQLTSLTHQLTSASPVIQRNLVYNVRNQPNSIQALVGGSLVQNLSLTYGIVGQNNGNVTAITNAMDPTHGRDQSYSYDYLNRVTQGGDTSNWGEQYGYDNWGNLLSKTQTQGSGYTFSVSSNAKNQLSNLIYDFGGVGSGEVTTDQLGNTYTYNAEERITAVGTASYTYDGDGNRVTKTSGGTTTLYWPSSVSGVLDESDSTGTYFGRQIFLAGLRVWSEDTSGNGRFLFQDHLGSTRVTVNSSGTVLDDIDYRSFGDVVSNYGSSPSNNHYVYTGYEDDTSDSSTDYAVFRNLSMEMGRFPIPDPYMGSYDFTNPQSLNRYVYVLDSPLSYFDPLGLADTNCANTSDGGYADGDGMYHIPTTETCFDWSFGFSFGIGGYGWIMGGIGGGVAGGGWMHNMVCGALSKMTSAARNSGLTIGTGGGGSAGAGLGLGLNFSGSVQLVATPSGEVGVAFTGGFGPWILGAGGQISITNAQNLDDVRGSAIDFGATAGAEFGAGLDYTRNPNGSVQGGSLTVGIAAGGKVSTGATYTHTWVPSFLSTNCGG